MPERLKAILDKITAWWKKFNTKQRSVLISIVAVVIVALVILGVVISRPTKVELVEAQSASEASTIKGVLEDNNISYEVDSKLVFFVNKSDEVNAIMALGDNGIPAQAYSIDNVTDGSFSTTEAEVLYQIGDPLQHLLRNSADHGLESNEVRLERGKPEVGTIFLNAYQEGNNVVIKVGDDGNGIDTEAVKNKAIERGIVTAEQAENLSQKDIINFLFMPSFSMAKQITDISGRGVGLDVVKSGIEQLGGDVSVSTELGKGTTFTVRLPLTLAIIQALMVEIRDEIYAIALGSISNIEDIPVKDIKYVQAKEVIHLRGSVIPIIRLDKMLDIEPKEQEPDHLTVVIVQKGDQQAVDNLIGQQEIVIKSLGKYINGNKLISGATILGDGDVALILDVNTLM